MLDAPTTQPERLAAAADPADHEAWAWLHATYRQPIGNLCLRSGLSPVEANEVIHDVLLRLSRRMMAKPERFSWEGSDCEADASASRGVSEARAGARPVTSERRRSCGSRSSKHDRSN